MNKYKYYRNILLDNNSKKKINVCIRFRERHIESIKKKHKYYYNKNSLTNIDMLWDDNDDSETWQIFKNYSFLKMPMNNKDRDDFLENGSGCFIIVIAIIIIIAIVVCAK